MKEIFEIVWNTLAEKILTLAISAAILLFFIHVIGFFISYFIIKKIGKDL